VPLTRALAKLGTVAATDDSEGCLRSSRALSCGHVVEIRAARWCGSDWIYQTETQYSVVGR